MSSKNTAHPRTGRRALAALCAGALAVTLASCIDSPEAAGADDDRPSTGSAGYPVTIDSCGEPLTIEEEPRSVLTIGTSALSLLDAAGASDRITARAGEFGADLPEGLVNPPTDAEIIDPSDPTTEKIVGTGVDLVVGYGLFSSTDEDLAAAGIANIVIDGECSHDAALTQPTDFPAIFADIERLGAVFGTSETAEQSVADLEAELSELEDAAPAGHRRSAAVVYYFSSSSTLSARGGQGIADDILDRAGLDNVYGDEESVYLETNLETLLDADPAVVVLAYGLYGESFEEAQTHLLSEPGAADLTAVQNGSVVGVLASDLAPDPDALRGLRAVIEGTAAATP